MRLVKSVFLAMTLLRASSLAEADVGKDAPSYWTVDEYRYEFEEERGSFKNSAQMFYNKWIAGHFDIGLRRTNYKFDRPDYDDLNVTEGWWHYGFRTMDAYNDWRDEGCINVIFRLVGITKYTIRKMAYAANRS